MQNILKYAWLIVVNRNTFYVLEKQLRASVPIVHYRFTEYVDVAYPEP